MERDSGGASGGLSSLLEDLRPASSPDGVVHALFHVTCNLPSDAKHPWPEVTAAVRSFYETGPDRPDDRDTIDAVLNNVGEAIVVNIGRYWKDERDAAVHERRAFTRATTSPRWWTRLFQACLTWFGT